MITSISAIILLVLAVWQFFKPIYKKTGVIVLSVLVGIDIIFTSIVTGMFVRLYFTAREREVGSVGVRNNALQFVDGHATRGLMEILVLLICAVLLVIIFKKKKFKA